MHLICECKTVYAVGAKACPQCGSTNATPDHPMPDYRLVDGELQFIGDDSSREFPAGGVAGPDLVEIPPGGSVTLK